MYIPECWFFHNLHMAKGLAECGYLDPLLRTCGDCSVDEEASYELAWSGIYCVFPGLCQYFNEDIEAEIMVFFDPLIDEFARLCKLYEEREGISFGTSPLRDAAESAIYCSFELYGYAYDYDFRFYHKEHGRARMVLLMGNEFCSFEDVPTALANVRNELEEQVGKLRAELAPKALPRKKKNRRKLQEVV